MQKTNILDFFKSQVVKLPCPACGILVASSKLNDHLDALCASSSTVSRKGKTASKKPSSKSKCSKSSSSQKPSMQATSSKLSLKVQRKERQRELLNLKNNKCSITHESDSDEVIVIDEIKVSSTSKQNTSSCKNSKKLPKERSTNECSAMGSSEKIKSRLSRKLSKSNMSDLESLEPDDIHSLKKAVVSVKRRKSSSSEEMSSKSTLHTGRISIVLDDVPVSESTVTSHSKSENENSENKDVVSNIYHSGESCSISFSLKDPLLQDASNSKDATSNIPTNEHINAAKEKYDINSPSSDIANIIQIAKEVMNNESMFSELSDGNGEEEDQHAQATTQAAPKQYAPYYIANFKHILDSVLSEEDNQVLFNEEDRIFISAFKVQNGMIENCKSIAFSEF